MVARADFDAIRTLAFGGISGSYADVGAALTIPARAFHITNNTDGDMMFSIDGGTTDHIFVAAGSFVLFDVQSNMNAHKDDRFVLPVGAQFSVKQVSAPSTGNVYVSILRRDTA